MIDFEELYDPDLEEILEEGITKEDRQNGMTVWKAAQDVFEDDPAIVGIAEQSIPSGLNSTMGEGTEEFIKSALVDQWYDWLFTEPIDEEKADSREHYSPIITTMIINCLIREILNQNTTIESLKFALNKLLEERKNEG